MSTEVLMPKLADTLVEGTLARWLKAAHDTVQAGDPIAEIETDKVTTELTAPASGALGDLLVSEGQTVPVGTPLVHILTNANTGAENLPHPLPAHDTTVGAGVDADVGLGGLPRPLPTSDADVRLGGLPRPLPTSDADVGLGGLPRPLPTSDADVGLGGLPRPLPTSGADVRLGNLSRPLSTEAPARRTSPLAARMAEEHGVDLSQVQTTGNRVTRADIERHLSHVRPISPLHVPATPPTERAMTDSEPVSTMARLPESADRLVPLTGLRRATAQRMTLVHQVPTGSAVVEADISALDDGYRKNRDAWKAREGFTLTYTPYFIHALAQSLRVWPIARSAYLNGQPQLRDGVHVGVAVALDDGLIVPVLRDADQKGVFTLARELNDLVSRARAHRLRPDEVSGGVATLTNVGSMGGLLALPMLNENQAIILGVGAITRRVVSINNGIGYRPQIYLSLTFDRRILNDLQAERFLLDVAERISSWTQ